MAKENCQSHTNVWPEPRDTMICFIFCGCSPLIAPCWYKAIHTRDQRKWLTPIILATQEAEIKKVSVQSQSGQTVQKTLSRKTLSQKIGLVEWLKLKALSSSPSTTKKEKKRERDQRKLLEIQNQET
jgi:hypothetical protein